MLLLGMGKRWRLSSNIGRERHERCAMRADYVVVGAGSAGCVVASRLSETNARGILLEAGPRDWHPMIHIPAGVLKLLHHPVVNWNYSAEAGVGSAGRPIHW